VTIRSGAVSPNANLDPAALPGGAAGRSAPLDGGRPSLEERRFGFGRNWRRFLSVIDEDRIRRACDSLTRLTEREDLSGLSFLDIGCGSGLFSLAASRLGARVHSFDFDPDSVACAVALRARHGAREGDWTIECGSALDQSYMRSLGRFDIVYAWGVLHHTGDLRQAMANAALPVGEGGSLVLAVYNDQGLASRRWRSVKRLYVRGALGRAVVLSVFVPYFAAREIGGALLHRRGLRS
jgi:2-polyprenyl-6-hydroxyphenyl methylase/3-demethylubiquinone-9 3-methyltransferase